MQASTEHRVTCSAPGPRNDLGKPKLVATITDTGLNVWCRYCRAPHLISREQCVKAWSHGESAITCIAKDDGATV